MYCAGFSLRDRVLHTLLALQIGMLGTLFLASLLSSEWLSRVRLDGTPESKARIEQQLQATVRDDMANENRVRDLVAPSPSVALLQEDLLQSAQHLVASITLLSYVFTDVHLQHLHADGRDIEATFTTSSIKKLPTIAAKTQEDLSVLLAYRTTLSSIRRDGATGLFTLSLHLQ